MARMWDERNVSENYSASGKFELTIRCDDCGKQAQINLGNYADIADDLARQARRARSEGGRAAATP